MAVHWIIAIFTGLWPFYSQHVLNGVWARAAAAGTLSSATPGTLNAPVAAAAPTGVSGPFV
jgi:hypothetical protein